MKTFGVPEKTRYLLVAVVLASLALPSASQAAMTDYCIVPPYVVQNVPPNVMIVVDTSGSMYNFAYSDGFQTTAPGDDRGDSRHRRNRRSDVSLLRNSLHTRGRAAQRRSLKRDLRAIHARLAGNVPGVAPLRRASLTWPTNAS